MTSKYKKYSSYKDSGVEWLGEIPESWKLMSNKHIFNLKKNQVGRKSSDYVLLSLTLRGIIQRVLEDGGKFPAEFDTYQEVKKGDFVFCLFDVEETPRCVGLSDYGGMITGAYTVMDLKPGFSKRFLYYFYLNLDNDKRLRPLYTGLRNTISKDNFFSFKSFVPPPQEQTAIANFLDNKTSKIDTAIAQKQKMIALLKERKQIMIQNAVTGKWSMTDGVWGPTPKEKMKDSGVEWIGEIPEGWEVKRLASLGDFSKGGGFSKSDLTEFGVKAVLYGDIYTKYEFKIDKPIRFISEKTSINSIKLQKGDLLFTGSGETKEDIGKCVYLNTNDDTYAGGDVIIFRQNIYDSAFLSYTLNTDGAKSEKAKTSKGEIIVHTYASKLKDIYIPIPSLIEQIEIRNNIDTVLSKIDKAISLQQSQIEKLKEYKSTLIDSAVTGKIKVTDE